MKEKLRLKNEVGWAKLEKIYDHYLNIRNSLLPTAKFISEELNQLPQVHTVKYRLKDAEHLIDKIIRKTKEHPDLKIDVSNYQEIITDLIGVRAIHLFKQDWIDIHNYIRSNWELKQAPKAYIGCNVSEKLIQQYREQGIKIKSHPFGYQSIHYLIIFKNGKYDRIVEIQVRTILEEAWSEIDHQIRYPYKDVDPMIEEYLKTFNGLIEQLDQMGVLIRSMKNGFKRKK